MSSAKDIDYMNEVLADALEAFWNERGRGARYRTPFVGVEYCLKSGKFDNLPKDTGKILQIVKEYLEGEGIIKSIEFNQRQDFAEVYEVKVQGCMLIGMEKKLASKNIEPLACPVANLTMYVIDKAMGLTTELVEVQPSDNGCEFGLVVFKPKD